jgi:hypothetical protein
MISPKKGLMIFPESKEKGKKSLLPLFISAD